MFAPVPWRYALNELPLDGQLVWVRRDAWSDRPAVMTWHTATTTFTLDLYSPGGLLLHERRRLGGSPTVLEWCALAAGAIPVVIAALFLLTNLTQ